MFPISDDNPRVRITTPYVNYSIIGICILVFLWQVSLGTQGEERTIVSLGMIPARLFGYGELPPELVVVPPWATILTSMFMHGGWLHLGGNMLYLWIFGDNIEDFDGPFPLPALLPALRHRGRADARASSDPSSEIPMVGASGAISGVLGAYILLHPARDGAGVHLPRHLLHRRARAGADRARRLVRAAALQRPRDTDRG